MMKMQSKIIFSSLLLAVVVLSSIGCGQNSGVGNRDTASIEVEKAKPTKEQMISDFKTFVKYMEEENFKGAGKFFQCQILQEGVEISDVLEDQADHFIREVSDEGIKILKKKGEFDKLEVLFPNKALRWLEEADLDEGKQKKCYAIKYRGARIVGYWSGEHFKFFGWDDIYKYSEDETESDNEGPKPLNDTAPAQGKKIVKITTGTHHSYK